MPPPAASSPSPSPPGPLSHFLLLAFPFSLASSSIQLPFQSFPPPPSHHPTNRHSCKLNQAFFFASQLPFDSFFSVPFFPPHSLNRTVPVSRSHSCFYTKTKQNSSSFVSARRRREIQNMPSHQSSPRRRHATVTTNPLPTCTCLPNNTTHHIHANPSVDPAKPTPLRVGKWPMPKMQG